jgi:SAM-dependent methyltransferase
MAPDTVTADLAPGLVGRAGAAPPSSSWVKRLQAPLVHVDRLLAGEHPMATIAHPQWLSARAQAQGIADAARGVRGILADIGCGRKPFRPFFTGVTSYVGIDYPVTAHAAGGTAADALGTVARLPLRDRSVDAVLFTEVLEHVADPAEALEELFRVLRPGGVLMLTSPMIYNLHGAPDDYFRFTPFSLRRLLAAAGFDAVTIRPLGGPGTTVGLLVNNLVTVILGQSLAGRVCRWTILFPVLPLFFAATNLLAWLTDGLCRQPAFSFNHLAVARRSR